MREDVRTTAATVTVPLGAPAPAATAPPVPRYWRIATIAADGQRIGPFGPPNALQWRATPPTPDASPPNDA